jgi:hypothetical protein
LGPANVLQCFFAQYIEGPLFSGGGQTWQGHSSGWQGHSSGANVPIEAIAVNVAFAVALATLPDEAPIRVTFASETPGGSLQEAALRRRQAL